MTDVGGGSSPFDLPFLVLQGLAALGFLVALLVVRPGLPAIRAGQGLHALVCAGLPLVWLLVWPVSGGIEGAGRFLVGAPTSLFSGLLGLMWVAVAAKHAGQGAWSVAWPSAAVVGGNVAVWLVFLAT